MQYALGMPTSTFAYTVLFTAGLALDARAKAARNRQWDRAFEQLGEALDQSPVFGHTIQLRGHHGVILDDLPDHLDWETVQRVAGMDLVDDDDVLRQQEAHSLTNDPTQPGYDDLDFDSRLPGMPTLEWPANTGRDLVRHHLPPQSLWAPDALRVSALRRRHTWKKLAIQELSTGLLIHSLIRGPGVLDNQSPAAARLLSPQLWEVANLKDEHALQARREILAGIERLQQTSVDIPHDEIARAKGHVKQPAIPSYFQDADGDFYNIAEQMNRGIRAILAPRKRGAETQKSLAIAKICHNLLISSASPDVQTFNLLLTGFQRWGRQALVDDVIAALYAHKIRPNEITCREILGYYKGESRPDDFSRFVAKMRGVGKTLMLADPRINVNEAGQDRLVRLTKYKVYQKVHPTPMVFGALIDGVMEFAGFDRALDIYYEMKADGWGLDIQALTKLLGDCIRRADWEGGTYVWEEINNIKSKANPRDMARAYHHMLSLCSVLGNTVAFNQVLNDVAKNGFDRKAIITAATKTTSWAQKKLPHLAPAWAADNVLIAVSDYVRDASKPTPPYIEGEGDAGYDDILQDVPSAADAVRDEATGQAELHKRDPVDPAKAWASWLEHEFGESPKDPKP